jgi:hypothetical protein
MASPSVVEVLNPVGRKNKIQVERAVFQLYEILTALNVIGL